MRGRLVSVNQLTIVLGILAAQITNYLIAEAVPAGSTDDFILNSWNGQSGWRWMFWAGTVPALLFFVLSFFIPESPRFWLNPENQICCFFYSETNRRGSIRLSGAKRNYGNLERNRLKN